MKKKITLLLLGLCLLTGCTSSTPGSGTPQGKQGGKTGGDESEQKVYTGLIESITLNYSEYNLPVKEVVKLVANISPSTAKNQTLIWSSSDLSVATVSSNGYVSGLSIGESTITCSSTDGSNIVKQCLIKVYEPHVENITLNYSTYDLSLNNTFKLEATISPSNAKNKSITWSTNNAKVASVNSQGTVSALSVGTATITCTASDGYNANATCIVNVVEIPVSDITLNAQSIALEVGNTYSLQATVAPTNATHKDVTFSTNSNCITLQEMNNNVCKVTAASVGNATITVKSHDQSIVRTCTVSVTPVSLKSFDIGTDNINLTIDGTYTLNPTFTPSNASNKNVSWVIGDTTVASLSNNVITALKIGTTTITGTTEDGNLVDTANINVTEVPVLGRTTLKYNYDHLTKNYYYTKGATPTTGKARILVVPIWFSDSTSFIAETSKENVRNDIDKSFFGDVEDYYSIASFYNTESYGNLEITGVTTDWYECGGSYSSYGTDYNKTTSLISKVMTYAKSNWSISPKDFDADGDGHIDGLCMIYGGPDCSEYGNSKYENLWAYTSWTESARNTSNPTVNHYFWSSYDFLYGSTTAKTRTGKSSYAGGNTSYSELDTHTFIHEFGHMLGLDDYYDYSDKQYTPAGGFNMQDFNVGGHDPFSVMALGWTNPYIPTTSCTIEINPFQDNGDLILLTPKWNSDDSPFDEYILLELYTPTGLNALDSAHNLYSGYPQGPSIPGIRVWHVDARLAYSSGSTFSTSKMTTNPSTTLGKVREAMSNTYDKQYNAFNSSTYVNYNLLSYIRKSTSSSTTPSDYIKSSNMFVTGNTFTLSTYKSQFPKSTTLNSGSSFPWTVSFGSVTNSKAVITLTYKA